MSDSSWQQIVREKLARRDAQLPKEWRIEPVDGDDVLGVPRACGLLTAKELEITETNAEELVESLLKRELTSFDVTMAFCKRAAVAHQLTNCLTEMFFEEALSTAKRIDEEYASTSIPLGPLHGLPVSLKDCFITKGVDSTIGFTAFAGLPGTAESESDITRIVRESGAVLYCKTNIPVAMMACDTYNNIYGYTLNPSNRKLSAGGSSGGESALLAMKGSPLGVGTDIGGSIRVPAAFCGLYSLKPSFGRFPTGGAKAGLMGQESLKSVNGPMSSSLEGVELWSRTVVGSKPWERDPNCVAIEWRQVELPDNLVVGLLMDDGVVKPLPPVRRALDLVAAALKAAGHQIVPFTPLDPTRSDVLKDQFMLAGGGVHLAKTLAQTGEPWPRGYDMFRRTAEADARAKAQGQDGMEVEMLSIERGDVDEPTFGSYWTDSVPRTAGALWNLHLERVGLARKSLQYWNETGVDVVLSPAAPWPAPPPYANNYASYTSHWNVLDQPGSTIPVTTVDAALDRKPESYETRNEVEKSIWDRYSAEESAGCRVGVQLVGRRLEEERLMAITRVIDGVLKRAQGQKA